MKDIVKQILARAAGLFLATFFAGTGVGSVSYTHLTLPTKRIV